MNNRTIVLQDSMFLIEKLGSVCATPGINADTQDVCNKLIQELLNGPVKTSVTEIKTAAAGIVTLT